MKDDKLITIIMSAYNSEKTIKESIYSALNQSYSNIEVIIIDDGSTDNTVNILNEIKDKRLRIICKENNGPAIARNYGINEAKGDYILFLDSDDRIDANILKKLVEIINKEYFDVILFKTVFEKNGKIIDNCKLESFRFNEEDIKIIQKSVYNKFAKYNEILGFDGICGKIINREFLNKNEIRYPKFIFRMEDAIFCQRMYRNAKKLYFLSEIGYYYVQRSDSICHKFNKNICENCNKALKELHDLSDNYNDFYIKCITALSVCETLYFFDKNYEKKYKELKVEYFKLINKGYFKEAIEKIDLKTVPMHYKIEIFLLRKKLFLVYIVLKKIYFRMKE